MGAGRPISRILARDGRPGSHRATFGLGSGPRAPDPEHCRARRDRPGCSSPAVQLQGDFDDDWLSHNLVAIAQLAEALDEGSLQLALRIVPGEWWTAGWQPPAATSPAEPATPPVTPTSQRPVA
jgi:hypothetical protein